MWLKKNDKVVVLTGTSRGQQAKVERVLRSTGRVIVEGVNLKNRRLRPRRQGEKGQVVATAAPLHISNVGLWCESCRRPVRPAVKVTVDGKSRICRRCERVL